MAKRQSKAVYAAAMVLFLGGLGYLLFTGLTQESKYFLNVSEALAMEPAKLHEARLFGTVAAEGVVHDPASFGAVFLLEDKTDPAKTIKVDYRGVVPDMFKPGAEVIVEGAMAHHVFQASSLITKCPSKYQKQNRES
ncbi:MAG: cytochrome c-type biosis protein CcmE [Desulfovibrionales bacterium]|nr:cytochrome c-type biosis protein CcmE [Desulfovibrionales bacterium]